MLPQLRNNFHAARDGFRVGVQLRGFGWSVTIQNQIVQHREILPVAIGIDAVSVVDSLWGVDFFRCKVGDVELV